MEAILSKIKVEVNPNLYQKEPFSSDLGTSIVKEGSKLIQELGMENFTFKKLSIQIGSTEAAIYRYFDNKHKLLLYLTAWYWGWMEHNLVYSTANLKDPAERLSMAIRLLSEGPVFTKNEYLNPSILRDIVVNESLKGFLTKEVDVENEIGIFAQVYKFGERIANIIQEINPSYKYPKTLAYTVLESSLLQSFNSQHLPGMTENGLGAASRFQFFHQLVVNTIQNGN
ncbi:TetR/AcrR family transcriptional regulator [Algoriphagus algorifonticola]|uniref:TetR/AcrR family transcriptional regulator n=1 Tax=Algoriphagus algorifonticola TaxID=2593007 RepID=UPI0011A73C67|nr:TetR/AcrR family transcriptional regulator [Algoriphagus algorifonticola]